MIVEFPDTTCNGARSSPKKAKMASARSGLIKACGQPSSSRFTKLSGRATVTGVGFFDIPHGQTERAERDRAAPGLEVLGGELLALAALPGGCFAALTQKTRARPSADRNERFVSSRFMSATPAVNPRLLRANTRTARSGRGRTQSRR
jgi:hypothetical protein